MKILSYNRGGLTLTVPAHNIMIFETNVQGNYDAYFRIFGYTERYPLRMTQVPDLQAFLLSKSNYLTISF